MNDVDLDSVWATLAQATRRLEEAQDLLFEARTYGGDKELIAESQQAIGRASGPMREYMRRLEGGAA